MQSALPQGALAPPLGPPVPTMKTLDQIASTGIAINSTNTPGNGSALFVITSPGSYFLTGNIAGVSGKNGIVINSSNVTVDLNGFALLGNATGLAGITDGGVIQVNVTIRHGSVVGWTGAGVGMGNSFDSIVADLIVYNNGGVGMSLGDASVARDCVVRDNTGSNIVTGFNANLSHCTAVGSTTGHGIVLGQDSAANGCVANFNKLVGISAAAGCTISHAAVNENAGSGIQTGTAALVDACTAYKNGSASAVGSAAGISVGTGSVVTNSTASGNTVQYGIVANPGSTVSQCTASNNTSPLSLSAGFLIAGAVVKDCAAVNNTTTNGTPSGTTGMGIYCNGTDALIQHCTVAGNRGDGINFVSRSVVRDNLVSGGQAAGVHATGSDNRLEGNQVTGNAIGILVDSTVNLVLRNTARNNAPNYSIVAGNRVATIVVPGTNTAISGNTGGTAFSTDASANTAY